MANRAKTPEEWISFLLTLIDHTKDFKPDWEGFAQETGMYKRGKFVHQAYNNLRQKYATGVPPAPSTPVSVSGNDGKSTTPKTAGGKTKPKSKTPPAGNGKISRKRKAIEMEDTDDHDHDDDHKDDLPNVKGKAGKKLKKIASNALREILGDGVDTDGDGKDDGKDGFEVPKEDSGDVEDPVTELLDEFIQFSEDDDDE